MRNYAIDQLALMPEKKAVEKFFDMKNYTLLVWLWPIAAFTYFGFFINFAVGGHVWRLGLATIALAVLAIMFFFRGHEALEDDLGTIMLGFFILVPLGCVLVQSDQEFREIFTAAMAPFFLLFLRAAPTRIVLIAGIYIATSLMEAVAGPKGIRADVIIPAIMSNGMCAGASMYITRRRRISFLKDWRHAARREEERERMREEIADARKIQLAMLPSSPPEISWLDISSVSVPATEVGGDFFEYFQLDGDRVVIAIGDVAGHGVGSGLVLAGIKSGLHLLREELDDPVTVVKRLNRLASEWLQWRMLVTLLIAVIDRKERRVTVVCAGHPPLLLARGETCTEIGRPALPLGTRLEPVFTEESAGIEEGDTILVYTDGATELQNPDGEMYEEGRLMSILVESASKHDSARKIRDPILSDISYFKDKATQLDDLSFVVSRVGKL